MTEALGPNDVLPDMRKTVMREVDRVNETLLQHKASFHGGEHEVKAYLGDNGLTASARQEVCREFEAAGWASVTVITSEEKGERPGLVVYTLHRKMPRPPTVKPSPPPRRYP